MSRRAILWVFCCFLFSCPWLHAAEGTKRLMLVSVAPYLEIAKRLGGDDIEVRVMVPPGASGHTYEPTPKEVIGAAGAQVWFRVGEPFETRAIRAIEYQNPQLTVVDLRDGLDLMFESYLAEESDDTHRNYDPHIWMSARMMQQQVAYMAGALQIIYPELRDTVIKNAKGLLQDLAALDLQLAEILQGAEGGNILVAHPAYGYFCRDYGLNQVSIEFEGKEPTAKQLTMLVKMARALKIPSVFVQSQYNFKGPELIAKQIGARVVILDPYAADYFNAMRHIARQFAEAIRLSQPTS